MSLSGLCHPSRPHTENQRKRNKRRLLGPCHRIKKAVKYGSDGDTNYKLQAWKGPRRLGRGTRRIGIRSSFRIHHWWWEIFARSKHIIRKCIVVYKLSKSKEKINLLMYMDDIELFAKKWKRIGKSNARSEDIGMEFCSEDLGVEFCIEKYTMLVMKNSNDTWRTEWNNQIKTIRTFGEKETYKYLGILEADTIKQVEMKERIEKEYLRKTRKLPETKLYSRNFIKGIKTWSVSLVRFLGPLLKWTREELMDERTRKLMTMHKALHPRDDVDSLYVSRKEGGRRLASIEDCVDASIHRLEEYIEKRGEKLITATRNNTVYTRTKRTTITRKQKWEKGTLWTF